jgi:dolichyl-phosphate-mannose--protein O-mannosyl transferase
MGVGTYFIGLVLSGMLALLLRALLRWAARSWRPMNALCRRGVFLAVVRAFPFAFGFAPTLLMKRGLGVLIPASLYLFPELGAALFGGHPLDKDDRNNLRVAAISFTLVWGIAAFFIFVWQVLAGGRKAGDDQTKSPH